MAVDVHVIDQFVITYKPGSAENADSYDDYTVLNYTH